MNDSSMVMRHMSSRLVIGIDQSYASTGIGIAIDGKLVHCHSERFYGIGKEDKISKRKHLREMVRRYIVKAIGKGYDVEIYYERLRTRTGGAHSLIHQYRIRS